MSVDISYILKFRVKCEMYWFHYKVYFFTKNCFHTNLVLMITNTKKKRI